MISRRERSQEYKFVRDVTPSWTRLQRIPTTINNSTNRLEFETDNPIPGSLLSSRAYVKWTVAVTRFEEDAKGQDVAAVFPPLPERSSLYLKPGNLLSNCCTRSSVSLNGYGFEDREARYWNKRTEQMNLTRTDMESTYTTSGAPWPMYNGSYDENYLLIHLGGGESRGDASINTAMDLAWRYVGDASVNGSAVAVFEFLDYLWMPPFNPYYDVQNRLTEGSWYRRMSNQIPYVRDVKVNMDLSNIAANLILYGYSVRTNGAGAFTVSIGNATIQSADLVLEWIVPQTIDRLPAQVKIPTWEIKPRLFPINNGVLVQDTLAVPVGPTFTVDTGFITLHQVPSYILIAAVRDKDAANYVCVPLRTEDTLAGGGNVELNKSFNSWEPAMRIRSLSILVNVNNQKVNTDWDERDIYSTTAKNCRKMPYSFFAWEGGAGQYARQPSQAFALFRPDDLSIPKSTGTLQHNFTMRIETTLAASTGFSKDGDLTEAVGDYFYQLMVAPIFAEDWIAFHRNGVVEKRLRTKFI